MKKEKKIIKQNLFSMMKSLILFSLFISLSINQVQNCDTVLDLGLIFDISDSIGQTHFEAAFAGILKIIDRLNNRKNKISCKLAQFSGSNSISVNLLLIICGIVINYC